MKRVVTFSIEADGRKRVQSISAPIDETKIDTLQDNMGYIDENYIDPQVIEGKKVSLFYNDVSQMIEVEYSDVQFEDLTPIDQIKYLKAENEALRKENARIEENNLVTQDAIMEIYELVVGGEV